MNVRCTSLVDRPAGHLFDLIEAAEHYPQFLPWCDHGEVVERDQHGMVAKVGMAISGIKQSFTTRNRHVDDRQVLMELVDGPFSQLEGVWKFIPLGSPGTGSPGEGQQACKIEFDLRYAFSSRALETVVSPVFDKVANTFVDSFVKRAEDVYGPR